MTDLNKTRHLKLSFEGMIEFPLHDHMIDMHIHIPECMACGHSVTRGGLFHSTK